MPYYTRANAGEVLAGPVSPLAWTLVWEQGVSPGWARGSVEFGLYRPGELPERQPGFMGLFGGYFYIGLSHMRIWGIRAGGSVDAVDRAMLGSHPDTPPYVPNPDDECPECAERIAETMQWILSAESFPEALADRRKAERARVERPDLRTLADTELVARARAMVPLIDLFFYRHVMASYSSPVGPDILEGVLREIGREDVLLELISGFGDVDSAELSATLWDLSRQVNDSPRLSALFDDGVDAVAAALAADGDADVSAFRDAFATFLELHGSRGPNEFDIREHAWETKPGLALALIHTVRRSPNEQSPAARQERLQSRRQQLVGEIRSRLDDDQRKRFDDALGSASVFIPTRERTKSNIIRAIHEVRMPLLELGRRGVEAGRFADPTDITMLMAAELDDYVAYPEPFEATVAERLDLYARLWDLEPPFIIADTVKPLGEWKQREKTVQSSAGVGDVLVGVGGCAGVHTGTARVVLAPERADDLQPGDILVAPATDPSWTPLFLTAGAVVVDVGGRNSHAVIISRELGIPCVVSVTGATEQIPDGAVLTVDGAAGTVSVNALAAGTAELPLV
jgi:pyruvate,water dikinase